MKFRGSNSKFYQESSNIIKCLDIYKDINYMKLLTRETLILIFLILEENRAKRKVMKYNWHNDVLMFPNLVVPRLEERENIIHFIHERLGILMNNRLLHR